LSSIKRNPTLRLRIFAGPNGSGKSTIINAVRENKVNGIPVDFGIYINADDITKDLRSGKFSFNKYKLPVITREIFTQTVLDSGLIRDSFTRQVFSRSFQIQDQKLLLRSEKFAEHLAQVIADFLRKHLLMHKKKFSFETVFSHESKLEIMRKAKESGYKVYLYFIATEDPQINKYRVQLRVKKGGHNVPAHLIESRYYRSLNLMFDAAQYTHQAFFFDNSDEGKDFKMVAHFKVKKNGGKEWDNIDSKEVPGWFIKYYSNKVARKG
jgi:predicted ABC-type ATPase